MAQNMRIHGKASFRGPNQQIAALPASHRNKGPSFQFREKIVMKIRTTIGIAIALAIVVVAETVASNANSNLVATAIVIVAVAVLVLVCVQGLNSFKGLGLERDHNACRPSM